MQYSLEQAIQIGKEMEYYQISEQSDTKMIDHHFDGIWQSIYDVCQLIKDGIIEDDDMIVYNQTVDFLKCTQSLTKQYQDFKINLIRGE